MSLLRFVGSLSLTFIAVLSVTACKPTNNVIQGSILGPDDESPLPTSWVVNRELRFQSEHHLLDGGARLSVRQIIPIDGKLAIAMGKWQSSGSYAYLTLNPSDLATSLSSLSPQIFNSSGSWGAQACASSNTLFDLGWVSTQQFFTMDGSGNFTNIFQQHYLGPLLRSVSCAFGDRYAYVGGSTDGTIPKIWTVDTQSLPALTAASVIQTTTLNGSGFLMSMQKHETKLFAKLQNQNQIAVFSLSDATSPALETTIATDTQGAIDIAVVGDLYVDSEYIISANLTAKTVQIFSRASPHALIRSFSTQHYPLAVYRYSDALYVSEASTSDYTLSEGSIEIFSLTSGLLVEQKNINVRKPMTLWSNGESVLVGGVWPTADTDVTLAQYRFVIPPENSLAQPSTIPSLKMWLRADQGVSSSLGATVIGANNDSALRWEDLSGNANHFVQFNATPPVLKEYSVNGLPAVKFSVNSPSGNGTTMCLANNANVSGSCKTIFPGARTIFAVSVLDSNTNYWQNLYSTRDAGHVPLDQTALTLGGPGILDSALSWFFDSSLDQLSVYPSNSPVALQTAFYTHHYSGAAVAKNFFLGGALGHWLPFDGKIAELLVFEGALSTEQTQLVESYLSTRYGF